MIKQLRRKLIIACMVSLSIVLFVILGGINLASYHKVVFDADMVLTLLRDNQGAFPQMHGGKKKMEEDDPMMAGGTKMNKQPFHQNELSPETPYESRFFSVLLDEEHQMLQADVGQIAAVDEEDAIAYAQRVVKLGRSSGFLGNYRYLVSREELGTRIIFLNCGRSLSSFYATLLTSVILALLGLAAVLVLLLFLSSRIVRPVAESYEKQKRFITDAGHELKTPMTIISADAELAELECGENQWITDIQNQVQRLTGLTNGLIYLSRMEEEQPKLQYIEFPISDIVEEMAQSFLAPAKSQEKELSLHIQPMLSYQGDEKAIRQLVSILMDNALKYSPTGGRLEVRLKKQAKTMLLTVSNTLVQPLEPDKVAQLFDRFYRTDQSRNSQTGGYGLGLSIAKSIVEAHKGKIRAEMTDSEMLSVVASFPN